MKGAAIWVVALLVLSTLPIGVAEGKMKVGLVFDIGGRGDLSFNDSAYRGLEWAQKNLDVKTKYAEPGAGGADREELLRMMARFDMDLVFGIGFLFTDAVLNTARDFPDVTFACIDMVAGPETHLPPNVIALTFREEDGSFLAGAMAAMQSETGVVGFVGGMDGPLIHKFEAGYYAGAKYARPEIKVLSAYCGVTGSAFKDPGKAYELALSQHAHGADVIYHASGASGTGVYKAAKEEGFYVIGVDSNQNHLGYNPKTGKNWGLTSMEKHVDVAVYLTIKDMVESKRTRQPMPYGGQIRTFGLADRLTIKGETYTGVGCAFDQYNEGLVTPEMMERVEEIAQLIIAGEITPPTTMEAARAIG